jgi:hypothetical protein
MKKINFFQQAKKLQEQFLVRLFQLNSCFEKDE